MQDEENFFYNKYKDFNQEELNKEFIRSCKFDWFEYVVYLLTSPELSNHADIHANNDLGLRLACCRKNFKIVTFLLSSPTLKDHANIHANHDEPFFRIFHHEDLDMIKYLIFDLNIEKTQQIQDYLISSPNLQVESWFELRELNKSLNQELPSFNKEKKISKV